MAYTDRICPHTHTHCRGQCRHGCKLEEANKPVDSSDPFGFRSLTDFNNDFGSSGSNDSSSADTFSGGGGDFSGGGSSGDF